MKIFSTTKLDLQPKIMISIQVIKKIFVIAEISKIIRVKLRTRNLFKPNVQDLDHMWCIAWFGTICTISAWKTPIEECYF